MATSLPPRLLHALGRLNAAYPWDHNAHHHRWIMRQLPRRVSSALDVGCGAGELARLLAVRSEMVHGVDSDADIVERARESTRAGAPVRYTVGDAMGELPGGPHQVITCVAVLHHLPFGEALTAFRQQLAPGGTLVVVGLARAASPVDHLLGLAAIPLNPVIGWLKNRGRRATSRPVAMTARTRPATMTFPEIRREARRLLPGVRLRRRLFWRYTMVWQRS
ncbi:2-polyprenyl-3-methyl-5-hydroxy-6-metoxy-1,4-benzoquinol methylase [Kitasatospora sp. GP30]|uniref:class I SAM-dependent methyltransferase n=1 Tax=Kitasatospora sp. GP30 TaxID=3035084 RepID=UPI000C70ED73|nr:class I SAM-dependent methyltransferase [Kitasatospora sp. GP30]MDH6138387.1 2-polyprenyl-3-methyl-5-hydroxy-6-metoxy-1,4-benzoquinol methylase [Kitasatospora sp. GP30]